MSITLSWWMLVPTIWAIGTPITYAYLQSWDLAKEDFQMAAIIAGVPAGLMLLTRVLP